MSQMQVLEWRIRHNKNIIGSGDTFKAALREAIASLDVPESNFGLRVEGRVRKNQQVFWINFTERQWENFIGDF